MGAGAGAGTGGESIDVSLAWAAPCSGCHSYATAKNGPQVLLHTTTLCFFECYAFWAFQDYPFRKTKKDCPFNTYVTPLFFFCLHSYAQAQHPTGFEWDAV